MPKRKVEDFISHWTGATASEQSVSQQFLCEPCDSLDVTHAEGEKMRRKFYEERKPFRQTDAVQN